MKTTNFTAPKHGAVIHLTMEEAERLESYWQKNKRKYVSTASIRKNPILPGFYADPEVLYSEKQEGIIFILQLTEYRTGEVQLSRRSPRTTL